MNFLQLGQRLALEAGVSGTLSTMQNQTGSLGRLVTWINGAWQELQTEHDDWDWMRSSNLLGGGVSFATVAAQAAYPLGSAAGTTGVPVANFGKWIRDSFRNYTTSVGVSNEMFMDWVPYDTWRDAYMLGAMRLVQTRPVAFAIGPDKSICLGPPPNALYTVTGDYYVAPTSMVQDTDVPALPDAHFHMAIVYKAMMMYAGYESASEVYQRGDKGYKELLMELEAKRSPEMSFGGTLA